MSTLQLPKGSLSRHVGGFVGRLPVDFDDGDVNRATAKMLEAGVDLTPYKTQAAIVAYACNTYKYRPANDTTKVVTTRISRGTGKYIAD